MDELLNFLWRNPWLLLILLPWLLSLLGDIFGTAARKAREQQQQERRSATPGTTSTSSTTTSAAPTSAGGSERKSPEEIAEEIRRMMGMERAEERRAPSEQETRPVIESEPEPISERWEEWDWQEVEPEPEPVRHPEPERQSHFGGLHERMEDRQHSRQKISKVGDRHLLPATERGAVSQRHLETGLMRKLRGRETHSSRGRRGRMAAGHRVDLDDPAKAFIMLEILGKPKSMRRDEDW